MTEQHNIESDFLGEPCESNEACFRELEELSREFAVFRELTSMASIAGLNLDDLEALAWMDGVGSSSVGEVVSALCISRPKATRVMRRLSKAGLTREHIDADDRRKCKYRVTNRGRNVVFEIGKRISPSSVKGQLHAFLSLRQAKATACRQLQTLMDSQKEASSFEKPSAGFDAWEHEIECGKPPSSSIEKSFTLTDTSQRIMLVLALAEKPLELGALSSLAHIPQPKASMATKVMLQHGMLEVRTCEFDARKRLVGLSSSGRDLALRMLQEYHHLK